MVKCCDKGRNYIPSIFFKSCANLQSVALSMTKYLLHVMTCNIAELLHLCGLMHSESPPALIHTRATILPMMHALPCNKYILWSCCESGWSRLMINTWFKDILFRRKGLGTAYNVTMPSPEEVFTKEPKHTHTHTHTHTSKNRMFDNIKCNNN